MNKTYTKNTYWFLISFHVFLSLPLIIYVASLFSSNLSFVLAFTIGGWIYLLLPTSILSILGILVIRFQNKYPKLGLIFLVNLIADFYFLVILLTNFLSRDTGYSVGSQDDILTLIVAGSLVLIPIIIHCFIISSSLFTFKKKSLTLLITIFLTFVVCGGVVFNYFNSLSSSNWNTFEKENYKINYSPVFRLAGYGDGTWVFKKSEGFYGDSGIEINSYTSQLSSLENWIKNEWLNYPWTHFSPYNYTWGERAHTLFFQERGDQWRNLFSERVTDLLDNAENIKINKYQAIKLPTIQDGHSQSYSVFISNGDNTVVKIKCDYQDEEVKNLCNKMISTFEFTDKYIITEQSDSIQDNVTACTQDAMQCPDGSFVGRTGPNCEFVCPETIKESLEIESLYPSYGQIGDSFELKGYNLLDPRGDQNIVIENSSGEVGYLGFGSPEHLNIKENYVAMSFELPSEVCATRGTDLGVCTGDKFNITPGNYEIYVVHGGLSDSESNRIDFIVTN